MAVNSKSKGGVFSNTPLIPTKHKGKVNSIPDYIYEEDDYGTTHGITSYTETNQILKYKDENEVLTQAIIEVGAKLLLIKTALSSITTAHHSSGVVTLSDTDWSVVLEALASSMHDNIALNKVLDIHCISLESLAKIKPTKSKTHGNTGDIPF